MGLAELSELETLSLASIMLLRDSQSLGVVVEDTIFVLDLHVARLADLSDPYCTRQHPLYS